ncbi:MAG: hypothetical protein EOO38_11680 [Cytophagaceae bacterium]|nr:MAG: hypothetical protein EOO38_11680 [Cytophagaceae bacterium]
MASIHISPAAAAAPRSVDAKTFDVAGVKTGMDYDQAIAAVMQHYKISKDQIKPDRYPGVNIVTQTKLPSYFNYEKDGVKLTVHFEGRVPMSKERPLVVSMVSYELPWSQENSAAMAKAAQEKYGEQSNAPNKLPMQWCEKPSSNPGIGCVAGEQAVLEVSQVRMTMNDPAWQKARISFINESQKRKPSF